ncbi:hypothetical protein AeMF1_017627 [Aphanomyces euteiches]|nr:hypothetical protein AeMF1_017627 [Aphanomyces euteiches]
MPSPAGISLGVRDYLGTVDRHFGVGLRCDTFVNIATPLYIRRGGQCIKGKVVSDCPMEWQYGSGLSYTTFTYSDKTLSSTSVGTSNSAVSVSVKVTNSGSIAGKEVVMLFLTPPVTHTLTETRLLKKFTKISLAAGESTAIIPARSAKA